AHRQRRPTRRQPARVHCPDESGAGAGVIRWPGICHPRADSGSRRRRDRPPAGHGTAGPLLRPHRSRGRRRNHQEDQSPGVSQALWVPTAEDQPLDVCTTRKSMSPFISTGKTSADGSGTTPPNLETETELDATAECCPASETDYRTERGTPDPQRVDGMMTT